MQKLSISRAWEQARTVLVRDGTLIATVALALIALPSAIAEFVQPGSTGAAPQSLTNFAILIVVGVIGIVGQLAVIRLAMGPSVSVGDSISHAARRALPYLAAAILIVIGLLILAIPFVVILNAMGVSFETPAPRPSAGATVAVLVYVALVLAIGVRMLMTSPVAAAETGGPLTILKRSWKLTAGHFWRLFGFVLLFVIAVVIALTAVTLLTNLVVTLLFGPIEPLSVGALIAALVEALVSAAATAIFLVMVARMYLQLTDHDAEASVPSSGT